MLGLPMKFILEVVIVQNNSSLGWIMSVRLIDMEGINISGTYHKGTSYDVSCSTANVEWSPLHLSNTGHDLPSRSIGSSKTSIGVPPLFRS